MSTQPTAEERAMAIALSKAATAKGVRLGPLRRTLARAALAEIDGPAPDWADVREVARVAGLKLDLRFGRYKPGRYRHGMWTWRAETAGGDLAANYRGRALRNSIELVGPRGSMHLYDPTPAEALSAARLVGLGGDSDA